ncbi:hypothetical protein Lepto7376_4184 [[Leptolyngbya] sp. PCC 7376]|uniref:ATP-binding protein n=1 Tax=[Leptolyngbya] sp. PCC 7376 TaxID=111781 RepID=UPI00029EFFDE|nr:ATP-binding protein [[Leptolyngbya] sp. PCC 7376]AFY40304.1 hypothetical protein Lepto7376_4184 [[Leptolyngbya] sp. PCC 7376]
MSEEELLLRIYNSFDPFYPLDAIKDADIYVDMSDSRGRADIKRDLGRKIIRSRNSRPTAQLYAGHRGTGKSTELLRLRKYLEEQDCYVVYFAADDGDIDPEDAQYTDILIACVRQLLNTLDADQSKFQKWVESRIQELKDLALAEVEFNNGQVDIPLMFTTMSVAIRKIPSQREKIRKLIDPNTVTLLDILKEFIQDATSNLSHGKKQLVVIVDNLDRIVPVRRDDDGRTNHEEIFIDRSEQLKDLGCDVVYTVPISIAYNRANDLAERYDGEPSILPITAIQTLNGDEDQEGLQRLREIINKRVHRKLKAQTFELVPNVFGNEEILTRLCQMSGGHVRDLLRLVRTSFDYVDELPITERAAQFAITQTRDTYRRSVTSSEEWLTLAKVARDKQIKGNDNERRLLFSRCILQYAAFDSEDEIQVWYDVHPLILKIQQFKQAKAQL